MPTSQYDCVRRAHNLNASGGKPKQVFVRALLRANEASQEMKILKLLRREDLRNEPDNLSVRESCSLLLTSPTYEALPCSLILILSHGQSPQDVEDIIEHDQDGCRIYFILQRAAGEHCWDHSFTTLEWHRFILDLFKVRRSRVNDTCEHTEMAGLKGLYVPTRESAFCTRMASLTWICE